MVNSQENIVDLAKLNEEFFNDDYYYESGKYYLYWKKRHYIEHHNTVKNMKINDVQNEDMLFLLKYKRKLKIMRSVFCASSLVHLIAFIFIVFYSYYNKTIYRIWPNKMFEDDELDMQTLLMLLIFLIWIYLQIILVRAILRQDHIWAKNIFRKLDSDLYNPFFYKYLGFKLQIWQVTLEILSAIIWLPVYSPWLWTRMGAKKRRNFRVLDKHREKLTPNPKFIFYPFNFRLIKTPKLYFKSPIDFGIDAAIWMIANNIKR